MAQLFDLQTLDKGLEAGTQLTDAAQGVLLLDGAAGDAHLLLKHVAGQHLFIAPELAELHALIDDPVGAVVLRQTAQLTVPLVDLGAVHKPDALVVVQIVPTYRVEGRLAAVDLDLLPAGKVPKQ